MTKMFADRTDAIPPLAIPLRSSQQRVVRTLDVVLAVIALFFVAPLLVVFAVLVYVDGGARGSVVFAQRRYGWRGRTFLCYKLRSMVLDADERLIRLLATDPIARLEWMTSQKLRSDPRITAIGRFIRKTSIDELPQLFNVLRGEMSLVGPRPIVASEVVRYGFRYQNYCSVRPGITGLWQISGRSDVTYRRRVAMDALYARRNSVRLYVQVLAGTAVALVRRRGAY